MPELQEVIRAGAIPKTSLGNTQLAKWGLVDVTAAPFSADPSGKSDSTATIQKAIFFARENKMVLFFPEGVYLVSDILRCPHGGYNPNGGEGRLNRGRDYACVLLGSTIGKSRPTLLLAPNSFGFNDPDNPKPVIKFWSYDLDKGAPYQQNDINFYQRFQGIDIKIAEGNRGAIGICCQAAQGTSVQDCNIDATHGYIGLQGGAGSGGSDFNVKITGGQIGLDLHESQPAPTIAGFTLVGQSQHAIFYNGRQTLTAVGCHIEFPGRGPAVMVGGEKEMMPRGQVSMIDSTLELAQESAVAYGGSSSLYLNNVFIRGCHTLAYWGQEKPILIPGQGWVRVREYAHSKNPDIYRAKGAEATTYVSPVYVNGMVAGNNLLQATIEEPPPNLVSQHIWGNSFPSWEQPGSANVLEAPYSAAADGVHDDYDPIQRAINEHEVVFLPKGHYRVTHTLHLKPNTKLVGLHLCYSVIEGGSGGDFDNSASPKPIIATADDRNATTVLSFLGIETSATTGAFDLDWRAGRNSIFRSVLTGYSKEQNPPHELNAPLVLITGNGGGRWYNFFQETYRYQGPNYRHLKIEGTAEPLGIYQCNPEHSRSSANMEISNAKHVSLYGVKSEGNQPVLVVRNSDQIRVFGYGGNAAANPGTSLFVFENTPNYLLANLVDSPRTTGGGVNHYAGVGVDAKLWTMLHDGEFSTIRLERPVLIKKGVVQESTPEDVISR